MVQVRIVAVGLVGNLTVDSIEMPLATQDFHGIEEFSEPYANMDSVSIQVDTTSYHEHGHFGVTQQNVLLTGATGFLGFHIYHALLLNTSLDGTSYRHFLNVTDFSGAISSVWIRGRGVG